jgi:hypothetical protein
MILTKSDKIRDGNQGNPALLEWLWESADICEVHIHS